MNLWFSEKVKNWEIRKSNVVYLSKFRPSKAFPSLAQLVTTQPIRIAPLRRTAGQEKKNATSDHSARLREILGFCWVGRPMEEEEGGRCGDPSRREPEVLRLRRVADGRTAAVRPLFFLCARKCAPFFSSRIRNPLVPIVRMNSGHCFDRNTRLLCQVWFVRCHVWIDHRAQWRARAKQFSIFLMQPAVTWWMPRSTFHSINADAQHM